jgi:aspartate racemase
MKSKRPIVILGGMGPQASSTLYRLLIDEASSGYGVEHNEDYPHIIVQSLAVPDFISDRSRQSEAIEQMRQGVALARKSDPIAVGMACNTAHLFVDEIEIADGLPFVSLIEVVADAVNAKGIKKVGLMASPTTIATSLYENALNQRGIDVIVPSESEQRRTEEVIRAVIAGKSGPSEAAVLTKISRRLTEEGAEGVILGCTELPLAFDHSVAKFPVFDCLDLLADKLLSRYYREYAILEQI